MDTETELTMDGLMHLATTKKLRDPGGCKVATVMLNMVAELSSY